MKSGIGPKTLIALAIIKEHGPVTPRQFSQLMWPDAEGHEVPGSCGHGVAVGIGMWKAAGSFLGKLNRMGLIKNDNSISDIGMETLRVLTREATNE
jgi:hypothetical protein